MNATRKPKGITVGMKVRFIKPGRPNGEKWIGEGKPTAWLCVGALGRVTELHEGYASHRCPDHHKAPDCICDGDEADRPGWVREMPPWATVEYEADTHGRAIKRAIEPSDEGKFWERVT